MNSRVSRAVPLAWPARPMKATTGRLPSGAAWVFEPKWDGHRVIVRTGRRGTDAISSTGLARLERWPWLADVAAALGGASGILDGEVIAAGDDGRHSFQAVGRPDRHHTFVVFDLLELDGGAVIERPWTVRRELLTARVTPSERIILTPVTDDGEALMTATRTTGFEGVIAKRTDSTYLVGRRSTNWIKVKHRLEQEFVIGGYLLGEGARSTTFGSLLLGVHAGAALRFAGAVGTGFNDATLRSVHALLSAREVRTSPFEPAPKLVRGRTRWVTPDLVAQVSFGEWTEDEHLRHPVFVGLRDDKPAADVVRERSSSG